MKKVLLASYDLEIGGVERSLINLLENFDYEQHDVDLMLYRHHGELFRSIPEKVNLLPERKEYRTLRMPVREVFQERLFAIGISRLLAKCRASFNHSPEKGYRQLQYMWKYALPFLPRLEKTYEVAISYLWPHYFVLEKVRANKKIAWIHTDYSTVDTNTKLDEAMWEKFDAIVSVSEATKRAFLTKYPRLEEKVTVIENFLSVDTIRAQANEKISHKFIYDPRFKIVTVARLSYAKGIDLAIDALKMLHEKGYEDIVWYIIGYGGDEKEIRKRVEAYKMNDSFVLLGKKLNPYPFMKHADIYVQPSRYEGKAVTVQEAQILAKAVLITSYRTAESQIRNGFDGIICPRSAEGLAQGIETLYHDKMLRKKLEQTCHQIDYSNEKQLKQLYALL